MSRLYVGPSQNKEAWKKALFTGDDQLLEQLVTQEMPGVALFEIQVYINGLYQACEQLGDSPYLVHDKIMRVLKPLKNIRHHLGPAQREADIYILRWIRRASALSAVVGAGVTMDAGGPSWPELVLELLNIAIVKGHEIAEKVETPDSTQQHLKMRRQVRDIKHFQPSQKLIAEDIIDKIELGTADTEDLMLGAQICLELFGQHMFTHITGILYKNQRKPGPIHRALASLAHPQMVPDRSPLPLPGWESIITYNFDDLMGEALDTLGLARASWAMRGDEMAGDPNELTIEQGTENFYQSIFHLHGYTPRKPFMITHIQYVFSTSQYQKLYARKKRSIVNYVFKHFLANPVHYALYIGCSFQDEAMNQLLLDAAVQLPGRTHFALLKWPLQTPYSQADSNEIDCQSEKYLNIGVQPVWLDDYGEIPEIIRQLK
jgi:hypothetical protein